MQKWEYVIIQQNTATLNPGLFQLWEGKRTRVDNSDDAALYKALNMLGGMGWEIITSHTKSDFIVEYVLRRPIE